MQLPSLTGLKTRWRGRLDSAARGTDVPAGIERGAGSASTAGSRERGQMRRRLRELRRLREAQLLELGAFVLEAHRHDRDESPVIKRKAAEAAALDEEARALAEALETDAGLDTVVAAGIAGPCPTCGAIASIAARFCSTCGTALDGRPDAAPRAASTGGDPAAVAREPEPPAPNGNGASPDEIEAAAGPTS
jgi:hypothetical protein